MLYLTRNKLYKQRQTKRIHRQQHQGQLSRLQPTNFEFIYQYQLFWRNGRTTVALNLPVTFSKCRSKHTGPGCARSGGTVLHCKKTRSNNG
ncbi:hypothetical protein T11_3878 [Trichinella zimbabwensis]|uniref:Uncharacterized protein n=1 Tax=Trichinella zimbabwensis TaxID=268475 RepID=A0A0V1GSK4_9BILA|nr:hypothetical protein T11_3878 [Trichinella zimbabwensis]